MHTTHYNDKICFIHHGDMEGPCYVRKCHLGKTFDTATRDEVTSVEVDMEALEGFVRLTNHREVIPDGYAWAWKRIGKRENWQNIHAVEFLVKKTPQRVQSILITSPDSEDDKQVEIPYKAIRMIVAEKIRANQIQRLEEGSTDFILAKYL